MAHRHRGQLSHHLRQAHQLRSFEMKCKDIIRFCDEIYGRILSEKEATRIYCVADKLQLAIPSISLKEAIGYILEIMHKEPLKQQGTKNENNNRQGS